MACVAEQNTTNQLTGFTLKTIILKNFSFLIEEWKNVKSFGGSLFRPKTTPFVIKWHHNYFILEDMSNVRNISYKKCVNCVLITTILFEDKYEICKWKNKGHNS